MPSDEDRSRNGYVPSDNDPPPRGLMRRLFALCNALELSRDERLELAGMLFGRDVTSFKQLVHYDAVRLVDAMVGYGLVSVVKDLRDPCKRCGQREAAGKNGECRRCIEAWENYVAPPEVETVIEEAVVQALGEDMNDLGRIVAKALHDAGYRIDRH